MQKLVNLIKKKEPGLIGILSGICKLRDWLDFIFCVCLYVWECGMVWGGVE